MMLALSCLAALIASAGNVVARVDKVELTLPEVIERMAEMDTPGAPASRELALDSLVLDVVLSEEARRVGLADIPAVRDRVARERRRTAGAALAAREIASLPPPSDEDLRRLYHATADSVRVRVLVFPSEDAARVNLALVQRSGNFEDAARSAVPGADLGDGNRPRIRGELHARLADAAFRAPAGVAAGPVELDDGWCIFKVLERTVGDEKGFAAQRDALRKFARDRMGESVLQHVRERLRKAAKITTDDAFLEAMAKKPQPTEADLEHVVATVNGSPLRYRDVEGAIRQLASAAGHSPSTALRKQLVEREIEDRLVDQAAIDQGLLRDPAVAERARRVERRVLAMTLLEAVSASVPLPSEKEIDAFYRVNVKQSGQSLSATRGQIVQQLLQARRSEAIRARMDELKARAAIVVDPRALQGSAGS